MNGAGYKGMRGRVPDTSKIRALTGWQPTVPLDQTLDEVIEEFRADFLMGLRYRRRRTHL